MNDFEKFDLAWNDFKNEIIKALRIKQMVEWLNNKLTKPK